MYLNTKMFSIKTHQQKCDGIIAETELMKWTLPTLVLVVMNTQRKSVMCMRDERRWWSSRVYTTDSVAVIVVVFVIGQNDGYFCCCYLNVMLLLLFLSPIREWLSTTIHEFYCTATKRSRKQNINRFSLETKYANIKSIHWECHSETSFIYLPTMAHSNARE